MPANSPAMANFRANVLRVIAEKEGMSVSALSDLMTKRRLQRAKNKKKEPAGVSRPFLSNLLNGHFDCEVPFAEEIAAALGVPLVDLLAPAESRVRQTA